MHGDPTLRVTSPLGTIFYINDVGATIAKVQIYLNL